MTYPPQYPQQPAAPRYASNVPLWAPYYDAPLPVAVRRFWKKYATFTGRASRSEYWWWALISGIVTIVLEILAAVAGSAGSTTSIYGTTSPGPAAGFFGFIIVLWALATVIPGLALLVRRLHDANFSAWMVLIVLVPFLGAIALLVLTALPPNQTGRRFDRPAVATLGTWGP